MTLPRKVKDETGKQYGSWEVLEFSHVADNKGGNAYWQCKCACGNLGIVSGTNLRVGKSTQCKSCHGRQQQRSITYKQGRIKDLYMIKCGDFIKIGVTDNIKVRLKSLQAANPLPIELVGFWEGEGYREEEWHKALKATHVRGEWFRLRSSCEL